MRRKTNIYLELFIILLVLVGLGVIINYTNLDAFTKGLIVVVAVVFTCILINCLQIYRCQCFVNDKAKEIGLTNAEKRKWKILCILAGFTWGSVVIKKLEKYQIKK